VKVIFVMRSWIALGKTSVLIAENNVKKTNSVPSTKARMRRISVILAVSERKIFYVPS
jgi:hypothetical protein